MPECNKYFVDLTEEDRNKNIENYKEDDVIDFIVNNVQKDCPERDFYLCTEINKFDFVLKVKKDENGKLYIEKVDV